MQTVVKQMVGRAAGWGDMEMVGKLECGDGGHQNLLTVEWTIQVFCCLV